MKIVLLSPFLKIRYRRGSRGETFKPIDRKIFLGLPDLKTRYLGNLSLTVKEPLLKRKISVNKRQNYRIHSFRGFIFFSMN